MKDCPTPLPTSKPTDTMTRFGLVLTSALAAAPLTLMTLVHLLALRAAALMGHWPRVSMDDPKYIADGDFLYMALGGAIYLPLLSLVSSLIVTPILLFWGRKRFTLPIRWTLTLLFAIGWVWLCWDPLHRMEWWID